MARTKKSRLRFLLGISSLVMWALVASTVAAKGTATSVTQKKAQAQIKTESRLRMGQLERVRVLKTHLKLIEGSGEFTFERDEMIVTDRLPITLQWRTSEASASTGRWQVRERGKPKTVIAEGKVVAPGPGQFRYANIAATAFLRDPRPPRDTWFDITIEALDASGNPVGGASNTVSVKQLSADYVQPGTDFGRNARFPDVALLVFDDQVGQVPLTQLYRTTSRARLVVRNSGSSMTDPMLLNVSDKHLLYRQTSAPVDIPALSPGDVMTVEIDLAAILPPAASQTPQMQQVRAWRRRNDDVCGPELQSVLDWRGAQVNAPMSPQRRQTLIYDGWAAYSTGSASAPVCADGQCVNTCAIQKDIASRLGGRVKGYSFAIVGAAPRFGAYGKARSVSDGDVPFTPDTPMTVASVSKWITAIAALSVASDTPGVDISDTAGQYFPDDWEVGSYFRSVTLNRFLGQRSGIKDYGNVPMVSDTLREFFEQDVQMNWTAECTGPDDEPPEPPVSPSTANAWCYSNINFAVFRHLLPNMANAAGPAHLSYESLVREHVFEPLGLRNIGCRPVGNTLHALAYRSATDQDGVDFGDRRDRCGGEGWYVSAKDMAHVLASINARDGRVLTESANRSDLQTMRNGGLGVDTNMVSELSKNGALNRDGAQVHSAAAIFGIENGPNVIGVLLINSKVRGGPNNKQNAMTILREAFAASVYQQVP